MYEVAPATIYWPPVIQNFGGSPLWVMRPINLVIRSEQAGRDDLLRGIQRAVSSVNPNMPVFLVRTMKDL